MCFFYFLLLCVFCVCFEADQGVVAEGGIVKQSLEDGSAPVNTDPLKAMLPYSTKQYLECFYEHKFELFKKWTITKGNNLEHRHVFFLRCVQLEPSQAAYLFVFFNTLPIERLEVTSCDKYAVQQSIFPPRPDYVMNQRYSNVYKSNKDHLVLTPHLVYKDVSGECYQRFYNVAYDKRLGRFELKDRKEKASFGGAKCGDVQFSCQATSKELKSTVKAVADPDHFPLSMALINEPGTIKQLVCTTPLPGPKASDYSFELICVKIRKTPDTLEDEESSGDRFFAFVSYGNSNSIPVDRFTVKSCMEEDIVESIFPGRLDRPEYTFPRVMFKKATGHCCERVYRPENLAYTVQSDREQSCPSEVLDWLLPYMNYGSMMWLSCKGPTSASGEPKTLP